MQNLDCSESTCTIAVCADQFKPGVGSGVSGKRWLTTGLARAELALDEALELR